MRQEDRVIASRNKILEAAITQFGTKGYKEATTNDICDVCGISKGLLFYHFKSKEKLFEECASFCIDGFDKYLNAQYVKSDNLLMDIRNCCYLRKDFFIRKPYYHRIFCEVLYEKDQANGHKYPKLLERYNLHSYEIIGRILENARLNPNIDREEGIKFAVIMMDAIDGEIWSKYHSTEQTQQMLEEQMRQYEVFFEIMFYGILEK